MNFCIRENDIFGYGNIMQASEAFVQQAVWQNGGFSAKLNI
jgi:hypothetical protein